ncbi:hypothetical protein MKK88_10775 [Methylobacterium sp. E-005]|nr:hypothetical protein [Methylobacterium sp. E-005]
MQAQPESRRQDGRAEAVGQNLHRSFRTRESRDHAPIEEPLIAEADGAERSQAPSLSLRTPLILTAAAKTRQRDGTITRQSWQADLESAGHEGGGPSSEAAEQERVDLSRASRAGQTGAAAECVRDPNQKDAVTSRAA